MPSSSFQKPSTNVAITATKQLQNTIKTTTSQVQNLTKGHKVVGSELLQSVLGKAIPGVSSGINTKLADSIFTTGAKDELMTVDIYGKDNSDIINTFTDKLKGVVAGQFGIGGNKSSIVTDLLSMVKSGGVNLGSMTERIVQEMGGSSSILNHLTDSAKGSIVGTTGITSELFDKMKVTLGDAYSAYKSGDLTSARGVLELMGRFCGDSQLFKMVDLGAQTNLLSGLINQAITLGVPEIIDHLIDKSPDTRVSHVALENNIETAINNVDLVTIDSIATRLGSGRITSNVPQAVSTILSKYRIPTGKKDTDYPALWIQLKAILNKIDPQWVHVTIGSDQWINLTSFTSLSSDVKKIVSNDSDVELAILIAGNYPSVNVMEVVKKQYPLLAA